ncbi:nitrile hydratase accessory protein [Epibacterium ulvae]|uniref:nitrile hydratase accessory protein n=1 Tax=Epibacterium ulvae TaxID=1156985 RepID=UPI002490BCCE|nr:nitrile hydratase accessory protein [Epibacterium ulvae]
MTDLDLTALPGITLADDEPVFTAPWEAQAFAMAVNLHQNGAFSWQEWAEALSHEIHSGEERDYYQHWLHALEHIVTAKSLSSETDLAQRKADWHAAAAATPHGDPILLSAAKP